MGSDFTSFNYPFDTFYQEEPTGEEDHQEPASEGVKTSVVETEHPLMSTTGLKGMINKFIMMSATDEPLIEGEEIQLQVIKDMLNAAYTAKFPYDLLVTCTDMTQKLDQRSSASDATGIVGKLTGYSLALKSILGRQPLNYEMLMSHMLDNPGMVKMLKDKAINDPLGISSPVGSKFDQYIFYKKKIEEKQLRTNKQVIQYFMKRCPTGSDVFPHLPLPSQIPSTTPSL